MGEECSTCKNCADQQEIRSTETRFTGTRVITNNNKNNIKSNKNEVKSNNKNSVNHRQIIIQESNRKINSNNRNISNSQEKSNHKNKFKRKEGRKSTLDSISFNEQKKSKFEEELRISLCSLKERKNSSGYCSSGGGGCWVFWDGLLGTK